MGIDIAGATIVKSGAGVALNTSLVFNSAGQGTANSAPGYVAWLTSGTLYYSPSTGWPMNTFGWQSGLNASNGVFTCPVAGIYAMGYNGIHRGGSNVPVGYNTYGYSMFCKNGAASYWVHWNQGTNTMWNTGGTSVLFQCAAGDTLALFVNCSPPTQIAANTIAQNYGLYPDTLHCVWCKLVG
jgi:hypothetical protein